MNAELRRKQELAKPLLPWDTPYLASSASTGLPDFVCTLAGVLEAGLAKLAA
jgi:hypothetical protein